MAAKELGNTKFMKKVFRAIGAVPVERKGNTVVALKEMNDCIVNQKQHAIIFPEGTRTRTGKRSKFLEGAARLAISTDTAIVPVGIYGCFDIWPPQRKRPKWSLRKKKVVIRFGRAIYAKGMDATMLTRRLEDEVDRLSGE